MLHAKARFRSRHNMVPMRWAAKLMQNTLGSAWGLAAAGQGGRVCIGSSASDLFDLWQAVILALRSSSCTEESPSPACVRDVGPARSPEPTGSASKAGGGRDSRGRVCYARRMRMTPHDQERFGRVTLVGLIIAIFGVAFMFGGHPVIAALLLLLAWVLVVLDEDMRSG
jgi:hypothetical protein